MLSRAHLLIKRDVERFLEFTPWGIEVRPLTDDKIFEWTAKIFGPKDTQWEGGIFRVYIKFDEYYNDKPPEVCFHTIPFHPNVDMITGRPCVDFLDDWDIWKEGFSLTSILVTIQMMLSNPVIENAVNNQAVDLIINAPHAYKQMVQDCVAASQRVEAGLNPHPNEEPVVITLPSSREEIVPPPVQPYPPQPTTLGYKASRVSFDDYYSTWKGIATSKGRNNEVNPLHYKIGNNPKLQASHLGLSLEEYENHLAREQQDYDTLMYGKLETIAPKVKREAEGKQARVDQINKMKRIYLQQKTPRTPESATRTLTYREDEPSWEKEVDDLVAWTNNLNTEAV